MTTDVKKPTPTVEGAAPSSQELIHLHEMLSKLGRLKELIGEMPAVDARRVAAIKKAIEEGTYSANPAAVAQKMLEMEMALKALT